MPVQKARDWGADAFGFPGKIHELRDQGLSLRRYRRQLPRFENECDSAPG
jgi:hypothetical protein